MDTVDTITHDLVDVPCAKEPSNGRNKNRSMATCSFQLDDFRREIVDGWLYTHTRMNTNTRKILEVASFLYSLIEILIERGDIAVEQLDERKKETSQRLLKKFEDEGMGVALMEDKQTDKYACGEEVKIDCQDRIHICKAACCRLEFAISVQDVYEGIINWDFGRPYMVARQKNGYCRHLDPKTLCCTVRDKRPITCRAYDCRHDERIWADFDNKIPSPKLKGLFHHQEKEQ